jgi:hypothetical protein
LSSARRSENSRSAPVRLAADFATRAAQHDRDASDPVENYAALREAGFYGLNVPDEFGGGGVGLLGWSLAAEELAQGCGSTALSFNMHLSVVGPMMESPLVPHATKERLAKMVVGEGKLIGGNFSEPSHLRPGRHAGTAHASAQGRRRLPHHRAQGLRLDDRRRRLRDGAGAPRGGCLADGGDVPAGAAGRAGAPRRSLSGTRSACAPRAATP